MKNKKILICLIGFIIICLSPHLAYSKDNSSIPKLIIFYSPTCHRCLELENSIMPPIESEFMGRIKVEYYNIDDIENYKLLLSYKEKYAKDLNIILPVLFMQGNFLNGKADLKQELRGFIANSINRPKVKQGTVRVDLVSHFKALSPLIITSAGLIDGINPCAFTVIVFFVSFLTLQGYKRRELLFVGFSFIAAIFITYVLIGLGLFRFFYSLAGFWIVSKIVNILVGLLSISLGVFAVCDFVKFKITGETEGMILQLPRAIKMKIQSIIGLHYRKDKNTLKQKEGRPLVSLILSAFIVGFLVSILEAVCTGQVYLPAITFVLRTTQYKLEALAYLLLYNAMFIFPLLLIFSFAMLGATSEDFSKFLKKHLLLTKVLMAAIFFGLGVFLIRSVL